MLQYPILLVHGMGFRDRKLFNYWGRIPKLLKGQGNKVYYGNQDSNGTIEENAKALKRRVEEILQETGAEKLNVIAHSKGGLDIRYMISSLDMGGYIASVTTMCTPHNGSKTVDKLLQLPTILIKFVAKCTDLWLRLLGEDNPNTYQVFLSLSTEYAKRFNGCNVDDSRVYYQSYACIMRHSLSDIILAIPNRVVKHYEGENDGLLTPESVKWGEFKGIIKSNSFRGISHCDGVDLRRRKFTNKSGRGVRDILEVYETILNDLEVKGM